MKIGTIVLCRYGSSRLPGKILADVAGRPILSYIHERASSGSEGGPVVVATSLDETDDPVAAYCAYHRIPFYRGALHNVAERFLGCAVAHGFDFAVRINGDNLFASPKLMQETSALVRTGKYDFVTNVRGRTYPTGMSVEAVRVSFYASILPRFSKPEHFEHVTLYLYENEGVGRRAYLENGWCPGARGKHMAIDTADDLERARRLFAMTSGAHLDYDLPQWHRLMTGACSP